ncbi:MAG: molybdopterin oxidoreductase [Bdellovibrionota bacterium]
MATNATVHTSAVPAPGVYAPSMRTKTLYAVFMFIGVLLFALGLAKDPTRTWHSYLTSYFFFTSLALGGLFFTAIQHVTKAGWSVNIRRFSEALASFIPYAAVGAAVLMFGAKDLYIWLDHDTVANDAMLAGKAAYLNMGFFVLRLVIFFSAWILFRRLIVGHSLRQDHDGQESHTLKNVGLSIGFLLVFALSYSLFSVDTLMSLQPHWYSTMWGVYCFAGLFQSSLAALVILIGYMLRKGYARGLVSIDHHHDVAKFMKAFTVFYAYIGFSQFLLIWYANLPEETIFYLSRTQGGWMAATFSLLVFKFAVPFLLMLPRAAKRSITHSTLVACLILVMQWVDVHWMVYPNYNAEQWLFSWYEIGPLLLFAGLYLWSVTSFLSKNNLVPVKDPRIGESIAHHVTY